MDGELVRKYTSPYKRFCLALDLKNEPELIQEYLKCHSPEHFWTEIGVGIQKSGIEIMDIYQVDNRLFMICEMPVEVDFEAALKKMGTFERQAEWGALMVNFQQALPGHPLEWVPMKRIYKNPE